MAIGMSLHNRNASVLAVLDRHIIPVCSGMNEVAIALLRLYSSVAYESS